jgi:hypothetical protein
VPSATTAGAPRAAITHVVVVWLENREASAVTAASMPYLYGLAETYGRADRYDAVTHPSLPNYLAFWSGSTQGVTDDGVHDIAAESLSSQLAAAGLSWRTYAQDNPARGCHTGSSYPGGVDGPGVAGTYARKHNPAMSAAAQGDAFLRAFLPQVLAAPDWPNTLLVVSFDEGTTNVGGGGSVFTLVARQGLPGVVSTIPHDHYGLLRTVEDVFGLPCLSAACNATPLDEFLP